MSQRPPTPMERDMIDEWLRRNRCCGSPSLCGAVCMDDEESWQSALVARELDRLRNG